MIRIVGMRIILGPRAPEAQDDAEVVFEKLGSRHVRAALAEVDLGPVLEARRLRGGWSLETGRLAPEPALDLLFADDGVAFARLAGRAGVAAALEPEVEVPDVAPFEHAHRLTNPFRPIASCNPADRFQALPSSTPATAVERRNGSIVDQCTKGNVAYRRARKPIEPPVHADTRKR